MDVRQGINCWQTGKMFRLSSLKSPELGIRRSTVSLCLTKHHAMKTYGGVDI
jgi:hypothetical protein